MECEVLITQDEAWRRGTTVPLKKTADEALADSPTVKNVIVLRRTGGDVPMQDGRDHWWHEVATDESDCPCEPMDAEDLLYLLYTSAPRPSRRGSRTPPAATSSASRRRTTTSSTSSPTRCTGARPTSAGSRATATSSTGRSATGRPACMYEGTPDFPDKDRWWDIDRALQGRHPLHGADGDPRAHEVGARVRAAARPLVAAPARLGRRADQPGGVGLVPRAHRRRPLPDRRHVVADRDGDDHDHAASRDHDDEAGLGDEAVPGYRRGRLRRGGQRGRAGRRRLPRAAQARGRRCCAASTRRTSATGRPTGRGTRTCTSRATAPASTRTPTSGCSAASTT